MDTKEMFAGAGFDYRVCPTGAHLVCPQFYNDMPDFEFNDEKEAKTFLMGFLAGLGLKD